MGISMPFGFLKMPQGGYRKLSGKYQTMIYGIRKRDFMNGGDL